MGTKQALLLLLLLLTLQPAQTSSSSTASKRKAASLRGTRGCNLNLCFALDGGAGVTDAEYALQKYFMFDVLSALAGNKLEVAAVQYGGAASGIHELTNSTAETIVSVDASRASGGHGGLLKALDWCHEQLLARLGEAGKIVALGAQTRGDARFAEGRLRRLGRDGFEICAIGIGKKVSKELVAVAGGRERLFDVDGFFEVADVVDGVVARVCGMGLL